MLLWFVPLAPQLAMPVLATMRMRVIPGGLLVLVARVGRRLGLLSLVD